MIHNSLIISTITALFLGVMLVPMTSYAQDLEWRTGEDGKQYWYENGVRQGTYDDEKGVIGDGTVRGREIYDPESDAWYWLDSVYDGAKAVNKEVWLPYVFQNEDDFDEKTINQLSRFGRSPHIADAIKNKEGKWVRYNENGVMMKGWVTISVASRYGNLEEIYPEQVGNTYYYDTKTGQMIKGWAKLDDSFSHNNRYYFDPVTGIMAKGITEIEGETYVFDNKGKLIEGAYFDEETGILKMQETQIDGLYERIFEKGVYGNINWWIVGKTDPISSRTRYILVVSGICDNTDKGFKEAGFQQPSIRGDINEVIIDVRNATDLSDLFRGMYMLESIEGLETLDTGTVTNMSGMFAGCTCLTKLDLTNFDTSKVTDMSEMFANHGFMEELDLSSFDTGNVTDMHGMFSSSQRVDAYRGSIVPNTWKVNLSSFDTSKVTDMSDMFNTAFIEEIDISSFDTSNVTDMSNMFAYKYNPNVSGDKTDIVKNIYVGKGWVIGKDTKTDNMFDRCGVDGVTVK